MSKIDINSLSGHDFFKARNDIGLSVGKVAEMTGINRNKLSQFEQVKSTITASEKKGLKRFYEERGYDFGEESEALDGASIREDYTATKEEITEVISTMMPEPVGQALIDHLDSVHDVLVANGYLDNLTYQAPSLEAADQQLNGAIIQHFSNDKSGEFKDTCGFLGDSASSRARKIIGMLAYLKLKDLQLDYPTLVETSQSKAEKQSDSHRVLSELAECLDLNLKGFEHVDSQLIA